MQTSKRKRYQKDHALTDDIITLIHLVKQNPALYNYKLQPNQRRRIDILNGWAHIAQQIGNKYNVEECRRKWKNLRDTYHQYRLRKPKMGDGLSKWRYAKELEFLSNIYQPKLKSHRQQHHDAMAQNNLLHGVLEQDDVANGMVHSNITLVNEDAETFILTAYEESVNDDVTTIDHHTHGHDPSMTHGMELTHHDVEDVEEIVKQEHTSSLDGDDATGAEVDYEEVCLYEEAGNAPSVDCETIIPRSGGLARSISTDSKEFQYMDANDFCIGTINATTQLTSGCNSVIGSSKLKNITVLTNTNTNSASLTTSTGTALINTNVSSSTLSSPFIQLHSPTNGQVREELDLFFDFLKKKMQHFSKEELTALQVEFLKIVLRRESECSQRNLMKPMQ